MFSPKLGRKCGDCTACCTVLGIVETDKQPFTMCEHQRVARVRKGKKSTAGCAIYGSRPSECEEFQCAWLAGIGETRDRPDKLGVVFAPIDSGDGHFLLQHFELRPGAASSDRARAITKALTKDGVFSATVVLSHGDRRRLNVIDPAYLTASLQKLQQRQSVHDPECDMDEDCSCGVGS